MPQRLKIFVSSPGDVEDERLRADLIIDKLSLDYNRFFVIESYRWEHEAMLASKHFQDAIELPSAFDIVVLILWSRLGTPLPEKTQQREYRGIDGRVPVTGTEWEYEEALAAARAKGAPDLLAFRNIRAAPVETLDPAARARSNAQLDALDAFWRRHFVDRGIFLAAYDTYRTLEEFARRLEESLRKLIERRIKEVTAGDARTAPIWLGSPFRGLLAYEFEHAPIFFGRDGPVTRAIEQLTANARSGSAFLLVSGASGSGKSSVVKAAVVPRLMKPQRIAGTAFLRRAVFRPGATGSDLFLGLAEVLTRVGQGDDIGLPELIATGQDAAQLAAHLRGAVNEPGYLFANALGRLTERARKSGRLLSFEDAKLILVVDQLEEMFTAANIAGEERRQFLQLLAGLARSGVVWVVATLRADFWHHVANLPTFLALAEGSGRLDLSPPSPAELAEMIRKPTQAAGLSFESHIETGLGLDAVLAEHAAAAPGVLPLLSFTLYELYNDAERRGESILTYASYSMLGGLEGAIAKRADDVVKGLPQDAQASLPRVLRTLTTVSNTAEQEPVARPTLLANFAEGSSARMLVDALTDARLLVATSEKGAPATLHLAHEALIGRWQVAREQLAIDRRDLETRTLVERQYERWSTARGRWRRLLLLRNPDLANAVDLARRWGDELDGPIRDFIRRSDRRARLMQTLTASAAVLFALVATGAVYAAQRAFQAWRESQVIQSRFLNDAAKQRQQLGDSVTGVLLDLEALPASGSLVERPYVPEVELSLDSIIRSGIRERWVLDHVGAVSDAYASSNNDKVLTVASDGAAAGLWRMADGEKIALIKLAGRITKAQFSRNGMLVLTVSDDGQGQIWASSTGAPITRLVGHTRPILDAAFTPDGKQAVTVSTDGTVRRWDTESGRQISAVALQNYEFKSEPGAPASKHRVVFSPNAEWCLTIFDRRADVWEAATGNRIGSIEVDKDHDPIGFAAFSPDGLRFITTGNNQTALVDRTSGEYFSKDSAVSVWQTRTVKKIATFPGRGKPYGTMEFSRDGRRVVAGIDVFDTDTGSTIAKLQSRDRMPAFGAAITGDGAYAATATYDQSIIIWSARTGAQITELRGHTGAINSVRFAENVRNLITASADGSARIWDLAKRDVGELATLDHDPSGQGHNIVWDAVFTPQDNGRFVLTGADDGVVRVWDSALDYVMARTMARHKGAIAGIAIDSKGDRLATASHDKTAAVWDFASGSRLLLLNNHTDRVWCIAFSRDDSHIVTGSDDGMARVFDANSGKEILHVGGNNLGAVRSVSFSPDDKVIATGSHDGTVRLWSAGSGDALLVMKHEGDKGQAWVTKVAFNPDGQRIASASEDGTVRVWNTRTGDLVWRFQGADRMRSTVFSPAGNRIVTASFGGKVEVLDASSGARVAALGDLRERIWSAAFSPDGRRVVAASAADKAVVWSVAASTEDLMDQAKLIAPRCLTEKQRKEFYLSPTLPIWCRTMKKWPYR
jgi:WD40 repeat protein